MSKVIKQKPCGWLDEQDCALCGRWPGWYIKPTGNDLLDWRANQRKHHANLVAKQFDSLKLVPMSKGG